MQLKVHFAKLGRLGGKASSPAKRAAARRNALKRWGKQPEEAVIPPEKLLDRQWYFGRGRIGTLALWDATSNCFWTVSINEFANPATYPHGSIRQARLKQEFHFESPGGTFEPYLEAVSNH